MERLVWLKKDLRIVDHEALSVALNEGSAVVVYIFEPSLLASPTFDRSHFDFIWESLVDLNMRVEAYGSRLLVFHGEVVTVLAALHSRLCFAHLYSHIETGDDLSYRRDRDVLAWCRSHRVQWTEVSQNGVIRALKSRNGWAAKRAARMKSSLCTYDLTMLARASELERKISDMPLQRWDPSSTMPDPPQSLRGSRKVFAQRGGETPANSVLDTFLATRCLNYAKGLSSPVSAWDACSRISPYLTYGNVSLKAIHRRVIARRNDLFHEAQMGVPLDRRWLSSLKSFEARLNWRCHFMQKLEDQPSIEFKNLMPAMDHLREDSFNETYFQAWKDAQTGYPLVDACMRALHQTGWINFRMRAMLVSFSSYHLWLHWAKPAEFLARHFLDYEPGIHYPQIQMQSGTTGINTIRIYSPIKQVADQDPSGIFIRKFVPELAKVPDAFIAEPHKMNKLDEIAAECVIGRDYPCPIVEHTAAYQFAKKQIYARKKSDLAKAQSPGIVLKHASRKEGDRANAVRPKKSKLKSLPFPHEE